MMNDEYNNDTAYSRNLGQRSILARNSTFLGKRAPKFSQIFRTAANFLYNSSLSRNTRFLIFSKLLGEGCETDAPHDVNLQSSSKQFRSNISRPNNYINFCTSNHLYFLRDQFQFFSLFSQILEYLFCDVIIFNLSEKGPKLYTCIESDGKIEINIWWKFLKRGLFLISLSDKM